MMNIETKERPIIFDTQSVRAILDGRKTQTRRVMRYQPPSDEFQLSRLMDTTDSSKRKSIGKLHWVKIDGLNILDDTNKFFNCPYGSAGDWLWVKETFARMDDESGYGSGYFEYKASCANSESFIWTPSIHMPRHAARIFLQIKNVSIERLNDITEEDASNEGIRKFIVGSGDTRLGSGAVYGLDSESACGFSYAHGFINHWESIHRPVSWHKNPFVWKIEFEIERMKR